MTCTTVSPWTLRQYTDCSVWALATVLVDWRTYIPPSNGGLWHVLNVLLRQYFGCPSGILCTTPRPENVWSGVVLIWTDFHSTRATSPLLVFDIRQYTSSTIPSSLTWLLHVISVNILPTPLPPPTAGGLCLMGTGFCLGYNNISTSITWDVICCILMYFVFMNSKLPCISTKVQMD